MLPWLPPDTSCAHLSPEYPSEVNKQHPHLLNEAAVPWISVHLPIAPAASLLPGITQHSREKKKQTMCPTDSLDKPGPTLLVENQGGICGCFILFLLILYSSFCCQQEQGKPGTSKSNATLSHTELAVSNSDSPFIVLFCLWQEKYSFLCWGGSWLKES